MTNPLITENVIRSTAANQSGDRYSLSAHSKMGRIVYPATPDRAGWYYQDENGFDAFEEVGVLKYMEGAHNDSRATVAIQTADGEIHTVRATEVDW